MLLFKKKKKFSYIKLFSSLLVIALLILLFTFLINQVGSANDSEQQAILENAISRSISQCYALDGAYPKSIDYLVDHYGLTYDEERYFIDYQYIGSNIRPDVTIIKRK